MKLAIITPNYNDWESLDILLVELNNVALGLDAILDVYIIDDGSTLPRQRPWRVDDLSNLSDIVLIELACNQGHQRAIALGLVHVSDMNTYDALIVLDCDGEDRPDELTNLLKVHLQDPNKIVVGWRAKRSEGLMFVIFYWLYKKAFAFMTGQRIDFGNFSLIPAYAAARLIYMPELWNHLAASILRSGIPIERVATLRGRRYAGRSSMNMISLVGHGLSSMSAFSEKLFVKLFIRSLGISLLALIIASIAIGIRLFSDLAIPGWATTVVGLSAIMVLQALTLSVVAVFMSLSNRTALLFIPAINGPALIKSSKPVRASGKQG